MVMNNIAKKSVIDLIKSMRSKKIRGVHLGADVTHLTHDSREVGQGCLFFAISGGSSNGAMYAMNAISNGAVAVVTERKLCKKIPQIIVPCVREAMSIIAKEFYGNASDDLKIIGITGTNGKTTTTNMIAHILLSNGVKVGTIGTLGAFVFEQCDAKSEQTTQGGHGGDSPIKLYENLTTPDPIELHEIFLKMKNAGVSVVVMECSAHAIHLKKLVGIKFKVGVFTNLSRDHLDFFPNYEHYAMTKVNWFDKTYMENIISNIDDIYGRVIPATMRYGMEFICTCESCSKKCGCKCHVTDVVAKNIVMTGTESVFDLIIEGMIYSGVRLPSAGKFNIYNAIAAVGAVNSLCIGIGLGQIIASVAVMPPVPGRFNTLDVDGVTVVIDYAHTPDSLQKIIETCNEIKGEGKLYSVFGCGGDRDKGKREQMGIISGKMADFTVITSDNPRSESPRAIMLQIEAGVKCVTDKFAAIECRREAIHFALGTATAGDIVLIAGKGAEEYQEIAGTKHAFNDSVIVNEYIAHAKTN